jgi:hypothetical protein
VDYVFCFQLIGPGDARIARRAATETIAFRLQLGPSGVMNRSVHTAAAKQRRIRGVHNRVDAERRNIRIQRSHYRRHGEALW